MQVEGDEEFSKWAKESALEAAEKTVYSLCDYY